MKTTMTPPFLAQLAGLQAAMLGIALFVLRWDDPSALAPAIGMVALGAVAMSLGLVWATLGKRKEPQRSASLPGVGGDRQFLRDEGWVVGVHNDYRLHGVPMTFWLFTHATGLSVKGEGLDDAEAVAKAALAAIEARPLVLLLSAYQSASPAGRTEIDDALKNQKAI